MYAFSNYIIFGYRLFQKFCSMLSCEIDMAILIYCKTSEIYLQNEIIAISPFFLPFWDNHGCDGYSRVSVFYVYFLHLLQFLSKGRLRVMVFLIMMAMHHHWLYRQFCHLFHPENIDQILEAPILLSSNHKSFSIFYIILCPFNQMLERKSCEFIKANAEI